MSGYDYSSGMSNRAMDAYGNGKKPLSKITAQDLKFAGWKGTKKDAIHLAKTEFWKPCEWHHSGGSWFNRVDFYDTRDLVEKWELTGEHERANILKKEEKAPEEKRVRGEFPLWGGSKRRPRVIGSQGFFGTLKDNWIFLDGGGKKKADGNHIKWKEV